MKKKMLWILLAAVVLCAAVLGWLAVSTGTPTLKVTVGNKQYKVTGASAPNEKSTLSFETDAAEFRLSFGVQPERMTVACWPDNSWEEPEKYEWMGLNEDSVGFCPGGYIYRVKAMWPEGKYGGETIYFFHAVRSGEPVLESPPELIVRTGKKEIAAARGASSWKVRKGALIQSSNGGQIDIQKLEKDSPVVESADGKAVLEFPVPPDEIKASRVWGVNTGNGRRALRANLPMNGSELELLPGGWFYEIHARWEDNGTWEGDSDYYFHVVTPFPEDYEESELPQVPTLIVRAGNAEITAVLDDHEWYDGEGNGVSGTYPHWRERKEEIPYIESVDGTVKLEFETQPREINILVVFGEDLWESESPEQEWLYEQGYEEAAMTDNVLTLLRGECIYKVNAYWDDNGWSNHIFRATAP